MRWWTSDLHIGHGNIIEFSNRPFWQEIPAAIGHVDAPDIEAMNKALLENYNSVVENGDEVWFVGDIALGRQKTTLPLFKKFKGDKILIPGNHDSCHPMHAKWKRNLGMYHEAGFHVMQPQERTIVGNTEVLVCHFPYREDFVHNSSGGLRKEDKFSGVRPDDEGEFLIHGHTHSPVVCEGKQIHVGVDAWNFYPVPEDKIQFLITTYAMAF